jgi:hypothetical protein
MVIFYSHVSLPEGISSCKRLLHNLQRKSDNLNLCLETTTSRTSDPISWAYRTCDGIERKVGNVAYFLFRFCHILRWQVDDVFAIDAWYIPSACPNIQIHQYSNAFGISWLHVPLDFLSSNIDPLILMVASTPPCLLPKAGSPHVVGQGTALAQRWSAESFLCNRTWGVWHGDFAKHQKWWFKHQKWSLNHQKWSLNHQKWWCNMI